MITRIDRVLGKEIFERMQDILPRDIGIMVGISDTSGKPLTGKRKYETSIICRENINPCLKKHAKMRDHKPYSCVEEHGAGCDLKNSCRGGLGNLECERADGNASEQAILKNVTVLYQCFFGLSNYAIPVPIGELGSIVLYGGQFTIAPLRPEEIAIEGFNEYGQKIQICEEAFRNAVLAADNWRKNKKPEEPQHLSNPERKRLLTEYAKGNPTEIEVWVDQKKDFWPIEKLEELLLERYNLSILEAWNDFLNPPKLTEEEIDKKQSALNSCWIVTRAPTEDPHVNDAARDICSNFRNDIKRFFDPEKQSTLPVEYKEAIISLRRALSTIEILKELAILISRTANVIFYKDTYLTLKQAWDNHPLSIVESYDEKWQECETGLKLLGASGWESPVSESRKLKPGTGQKGFKQLMGELTKSLMFFAYKLLFDDFRSVISMLTYNYDIKAKDWNYENSLDLINRTEICFKNIRTASSIFISDLLADKYERHARKKRLEGDRDSAGKSENQAKSLLGSYLKGVNVIRWELEKYYTQKETKYLELLESKSVLSRALDGSERDLSKELDKIKSWRGTVFKSLKEIFESESEKTEEILKDDMMLRFFYLVFGTSQDDTGTLQDELERIEANLDWADAEIRNQIQNVSSTNMLEFDICQSLLHFMSKLRDYVYTSRFEVLETLAEKNEGFRNKFMPEGQTSCQYFVDHGIEHAKIVLKNVDALIKFSQSHAEEENDNVQNICESPVWQYYLKSAALFHDIGIFSEQFYESAYGGRAAIIRCHGAFSAKRIVEEEGFALLGNDLDRLIIGQLCAHHQNSADISCLEKKLKILGSMLRIADDFDIRETRVRELPSRQLIDNSIDKLYNKIVTILEKSRLYELSNLRIPRLSRSHKSPEEQAEETKNQIRFFNQLQKRILEIANRENQSSIGLPDGTCIDFVNAPPTKKEETSELTEALRCCSEINAILEATLQCQEHLSVKNVELIHFPKSHGSKEKDEDTCMQIPRENRRHYLVPVISFQRVMDTQIMQDPIMTLEYQPQVLAKVKAEFKREIDILKPYLEQAGIRLSNPRVQQLCSSSGLKERNLLFINAPIATSKMKFIGAPTSLLYAISEISDKIDQNHDFMDVNIEIFDPTCFGKGEQEELRGILRDLHPIIIGISNTSAGHYNALEIAKFIRTVEDTEWKSACEIEQLVRKGINNVEEIASKTKIDRSKVERLMKEHGIELKTKEEGGENVPQKAIIIIGGPHENVCFDKTIQKHHDCIDISIGGIPEILAQDNEYHATQGFRAEAEDILLKIVERVLEKVNEGRKLSSIQELVEAEPPLYEKANGMFTIAYYDGTRVQKRESRRRALDICTLPNPPRHLLQDSNRYDYGIFKNELTRETGKTAQVITTRGCIHRCIFCSSVGTVSRRTVDNVLKELEKLRENGYQAIFFDDSTFADECEHKPIDNPYTCTYTGDPCSILASKLLGEKDEEIRKRKEQIKEIESTSQGEPTQQWKQEGLKTDIEKLIKEKEVVEGIIKREGYEIGKCGYAIKLSNRMAREGLKFVWGCQTRADVVHEKLLKAMISAGCKYVYFGIESLNNETLKKMGKNIAPEDIVSGVKRTRAEGLNVGFSLVFGLEGENVEETMKSLRKLLNEPGAPSSKVSCVSINLATIYPGTKLEERMKKMGNGIPDFDEKPQFDKPPFTEFEESGWNILPCFASKSESRAICIQKSEDLARDILRQSRMIIGKRLVSGEYERTPLEREQRGNAQEITNQIDEAPSESRGLESVRNLGRGVVLDESRDKREFVKPEPVPQIPTPIGKKPPPVAIYLGSHDTPPQYGLLGWRKDNDQEIFLDLNKSKTISIFGAPREGKSYTIGVIAEMSLLEISHLNELKIPSAVIVFHYSKDEDYRPEYISLRESNDQKSEIETLAGLDVSPQGIKEAVIVVPPHKIETRRKEYAGFEVHPLQFNPSELGMDDWLNLIGAPKASSKALYIEELKHLLRELEKKNTLNIRALYQAIEESPALNKQTQKILTARLRIAEQYMCENSALKQLIKPGRMTLLDLRDKMLERDEAMRLCLILLKVFSDVREGGRIMNKLIILDEAHKYLRSGFASEIEEVVSEAAHRGNSYIIASQDPLSVPSKIIGLSNIVICHRITDNKWIGYIKSACKPFQALEGTEFSNLKKGEAFIWAREATSEDFTTRPIKTKIRPRVSKHGGHTITALQ